VFEPGRDYFPDRAAFRRSTQLTASYHGYYKRLRLVTSGIGEEFQFVLVQRGAPPPPLQPDDIVVRVPVQRFSLGTYRYGGVAEALGVTDRLVGFGNHTNATAPAIVALFDKGVLQRNFDLEAVANRGTEAHFNWYATSALASTDDVFARMGSLVIPAAEHMEPTPVARAEWIKFFAMFFNKEAEANALFDGIEARYEARRRLVADVTRRPRVFVNLPQGDAWNIFGGRNQLARIYADAGGDYVWADNPSPESGTTVHYEAALDRGLDADFWMMGADGAFGVSIANLSLGNPRFSAFRSVRAGRVYINHVNYPDGPNPWWDYALIQPDEDLADLIAIFHPERLPDRRLVFWKRLDLRDEQDTEYGAWHELSCQLRSLRSRRKGRTRRRSHTGSTEDRESQRPG
jgi:iron complex transport system substrate-binding protein